MHKYCVEEGKTIILRLYYIMRMYIKIKIEHISLKEIKILLMMTTHLLKQGKLIS